MTDVELTELETIRKFSVATRGATAPVEEVIGALRADLDALTQDLPQPHPIAAEAEAPVSGAPVTKTASRQSATTKNRTGGRSGGRKRSRVG
ncbi:MAG: hypothetical protein M3O70_18040 [Actinomycetota bacterium]|nr:hypothetical protein [Actinomycetota bacterium]